ncbi:MAG: J domain-containing protein [Patescibacteria group bacterium]|nr:J domain-containing protein [Patescibacteria group bacterium]
MKCTITQSGNDYAVKTPWHPKKSKLFSAMLRRYILRENANWVPSEKTWIIKAESIETAVEQVEAVFGEKLKIPELKPVETGQKYSFQLDYLGIPKERPGETGKTSLGLSKGDWRVVFSEAILQAWFEKEPGSKEETLFSALLVSETATEQEIKSGYRKMSRQWHPDFNRDNELGQDYFTERFRKINEAYLILSDPLKRKKYQAGLYLERSSNQEKPDYFNRKFDYFIPPLRCGNLTVTGSITVGRLRVSEIFEWSDCVNGQGQVMVSSWDKATQAVRIEWV